MAVLPIRTFGDPALRQRAAEIERVTQEHRRLAKDMLDTMREAPGVGLAAPQVGVLDRIFVWEVEERHGVMINPVIVWRSDEMTQEEEGCLSIPGIAYPVTRHERVRVEGLDEEGSPGTIDGEGLLARVCQHEIDHLDGVLFIYRLNDDLRKEAMRTLRDQALGPAPRPATAGVPREERV